MLAEVPQSCLAGAEVAQVGQAGADHFPPGARPAGGAAAAPAGSLGHCGIQLSLTGQTNISPRLMLYDVVLQYIKLSV